MGLDDRWRYSYMMSERGGNFFNDGKDLADERSWQCVRGG